jgi:hypothetical protein
MTESTPPRGIFISYRREETAPYAGRLSDRLRTHFGEDRIFMDVDSIVLGRDFVESITSAVTSCVVLLALIGPEWANARDSSGQRRLDDPHDFVRLEIETALQRNVPIVPILVNGAEMPRIEALPQSLQGLTRRQALKLTHEDFRAQTHRLIESIAQVLPASAATDPSPGFSQGRGTEAPTTVAAEEITRQAPMENTTNGKKVSGKAIGAGFFVLWSFWGLLSRPSNPRYTISQAVWGIGLALGGLALGMMASNDALAKKARGEPISELGSVASLLFIVLPGLFLIFSHGLSLLSWLLAWPWFW